MPRQMPKTNKKRTPYLTSDQIYAEWVKWRDSNPDPSKRTISPTLGKYIMMVATHMLRMPQFSGYPSHVKDDLV